MSNTMLTSLTNALTEIANRRNDVRSNERLSARDENESETFGSMVSEWTKPTQNQGREPVRASLQRDAKPEIEPEPFQAPKSDDRPTQARQEEPRADAGEPTAQHHEASSRTNEGQVSRSETTTDEPGDTTNPSQKTEGEEEAKSAVEAIDEGETASIDPSTIVEAGPVSDPELVASVPLWAAPSEGETPTDGTVKGTIQPSVAAIGATATATAQAIVMDPATGDASAVEPGALALLGQSGAQQAKAEETAGAMAAANGIEPGDSASPEASLLSAAAEAATKVAKPTEGANGAPAVDAKSPASAQAHHPVRTTPFGELINGMGTQNAIYRPADILAGLDRELPSFALGQTANTAIRPTPLQMLPIEIGMQAVRGVTNFQIRLDPAELGRVDVKLQIKENGEVNASLVVDRVETLQMLRRDASTLQQAFEQAGLKQSTDGLTFSLRGEGQPGQQQERGRQGSSQAGLEDVGLQPQMGELVMRRALIPNTSLDLMI